jgi:hypothetical protein
VRRAPDASVTFRGKLAAPMALNIPESGNGTFYPLNEIRRNLAATAH